MKEYLYRNKTTGQEVKRNVWFDNAILKIKGYELVNVIDYDVTEAEKKAK